MNNFRVMMPSGRVCSVNEVRPITEKVVSFNGSKHRFLEVVKNLNDDTNGISIIRAYEDNMFEGVFSREIIIGNLTNEKVQKILRQINEKGYYDFSEFKYQKVKTFEDIRFGDKFPPYTSENNVLISPIPTGFPMNPLQFQASNNSEIFASDSASDNEIDMDTEGDDAEE